MMPPIYDGAAAIVRAFDSDAAVDDALGCAMVHLQPIVALGHMPTPTPRLVAVEALTRWSHPAVGPIPPEALFSVIGAERSARLGSTVREQALAAFAALPPEYAGDARVALNLSAAEVCRADIALHIMEQVERAGLSLRSTEVEITEEVLLDRVSSRTLDQLAALRGRGARLVLDDFGTGTSGLAQLLRLPLDGVKLDKHFVQRLGKDARAEEIVRATVSLAHGLGLQVAAEGVETLQQAAMLRGPGVRHRPGLPLCPAHAAGPADGVVTRPVARRSAERHDAEAKGHAETALTRVPESRPDAAGPHAPPCAGTRAVVRKRRIHRRAPYERHRQPTPAHRQEPLRRAPAEGSPVRPVQGHVGLAQGSPARPRLCAASRRHQAAAARSGGPGSLDPLRRPDLA